MFRTVWAGEPCPVPSHITFPKRQRPEVAWFEASKPPQASRYGRIPMAGSGTLLNLPK